MNPSPAAPRAPAVLAVRNLSVRYGGVAALSNVDLEVAPGEVLAVIGPNGAGKSTLFNALSGHAGSHAGSLAVAGQALRPSRSQVWGARTLVVVAALVAAVASANVERGWSVAINQIFRLHCAGRDTRGCQIAWSDVGAASWATFAGGPTLSCEADPSAVCAQVKLTSPGAADALYATLPQARAALPAAWSRAAQGWGSPVATTLLHRAWVACLAGAAAAWVLGRQLRQAGRSATTLARAGVARTFQNIRIFAAMTVADNVRVALPGCLGAREAEDRLQQLLAQVDLTSLAAASADALSYGEMRRLEVARALACAPKVLLLDEPAAGMNAQETQQILQLVRQVRAEGMAVLLIEHDMPLVMGVSDRVVVLEYGRKIAEGTPAEVRRNPQVIRAYLGASDAVPQALAAAVAAAAEQESTPC